MNRFLPAVLALGVLLSLAPAAHAYDNVIGVSWNVALPTQNTRDWIPGTSFRGVAVEGRWMQRNHSFGVYAGWQVLNDKVTETASLAVPGGSGGADVTGTQFRYQNIFPLLLTAHYYLGDDARKNRFYAGLGAGMYSIENRVDLGVFALEDNNWHFGLSPELGLWMPMGWNTKLYLAARYHHAFSSGDVDAQSWVQFSVGLANF